MDAVRLVGPSSRFLVMSEPSAPGAGGFAALDPNSFIDAVARALDRPLTGLCRPYASYINRVYELQGEDGTSLVAKFYRPGRWSREALLEEHAFLAELVAAEQPVIPPMALADGGTLGRLGDVHFAVFPKKGGRMLDEPKEGDWLAIGRLLGRLHAVGAQHPALQRVILHPGQVTASQLSTLLDGSLITAPQREGYERVAREFLELAEARFEGVELQRIHGDLRHANLIHRPGEGTFVVDFDDLAMGPVVQDLWLLLPGTREACEREIGFLTEGYETFLEFPREQLALIEVLRGMRFIHFSAWCAHQRDDANFAEHHPGWGTPRYWEEERAALEAQLELVREGG